MDFEENAQHQVKLKEFNSGVGYVRGAGVLKESAWYIVKMIFFLSALPYPYRFKRFLLKLFGAKMGENIVIKPRVNIHMPWHLSIGNDVWIGEEVYLLNLVPITIGNDVCISQRAFLCTGNHDYRKPSMDYRNQPIILNDGCWVGASVFVGPGVTVGKNTVIAAGGVVTSTTEANVIYKGNPALIKGNRWRV